MIVDNVYGSRFVSAPSGLLPARGVKVSARILIDLDEMRKTRSLGVTSSGALLTSGLIVTMILSKNDSAHVLKRGESVAVVLGMPFFQQIYL